MEATESGNRDGGRKIWGMGMSSTPSERAMVEVRGSSEVAETEGGGEGSDERRGRSMSSREICTSFRGVELSGALFRRIPFDRALLSSFSTESASTVMQNKRLMVSGSYALNRIRLSKSYLKKSTDCDHAIIGESYNTLFPIFKTITTSRLLYTVNQSPFSMNPHLLHTCAVFV
jgi:hypothetical protein